MIVHKSRFEVGDCVCVDKDTKTELVVTGVLFRHGNRVTYEFSWIANGDPKSAWIEDFRCGAVPALVTMGYVPGNLAGEESMGEGRVKCLVLGCKNHSDAGHMVGPLCAPCDTMLRTGQVHERGLTFVHGMSRQLKAVNALIRSAKDVLDHGAPR